MTALYVQFGIVTAQPSLVEFLTEVFGFAKTTEVNGQIGTVVKLQGPGGVVLNLLIPIEQPQPAPRAEPFYAMSGLRYVTVRVDDLDGVVDRALSRGGHLIEPARLVGAIRCAFLADLDGNCFEVTEATA